MTWPQFRRAECRIGEWIIRLTRREADLLLLLMLRCPEPVTLNEMIEWIWPYPDDEPDSAEGNAYEAMRSLRYKIGSYRVIGRKGFGYYLRQFPGQ